MDYRLPCTVQNCVCYVFITLVAQVVLFTPASPQNLSKYCGGALELDVTS